MQLKTMVLVFIFMMQTYITSITRLSLENDIKWKLGWTLPLQDNTTLCKFTYVMRMFTNIVYTYGRRVIQWVNRVCDKLHVCLVISQILKQISFAVIKSMITG